MLNLNLKKTCNPITVGDIGLSSQFESIRGCNEVNKAVEHEVTVTIDCTGDDKARRPCDYDTTYCVVIRGYTSNDLHTDVVLAQIHTSL